MSKVVETYFDRDYICPDRSITMRSTPRVIKGLVNVRLMASKFPDTFEIPPESRVRKVGPGDFVKVARNRERFWLRLDGFVGRSWHGTLVNELENNDDLKIGDSIFFHLKNIYTVQARC